MCWYSAITILLASWNTVSSLQVGLSPANSSATLLCSLIQMVCITNRFVCSLTLKSPVKIPHLKSPCAIYLYHTCCSAFFVVVCWATTKMARFGQTIGISKKFTGWQSIFAVGVFLLSKYYMNSVNAKQKLRHITICWSDFLTCL